MTASPHRPGRRIAGLFLAALTAVLTAVGLALSQLGWVALGPYLAAVLLGLGLLVRYARSLAPQGKSHGRTCTCCTSTVYDPVEVR